MKNSGHTKKITILFLRLEEYRFFVVVGLMLILSISPIVYAQNSTRNSSILKLSSGQVSFGSGDFQGFLVGLEISQRRLKQKSSDKLLLGAELLFENGVKNPPVKNATLQEMLQTFNHVSNTILWPKISYYPFKNFTTGLNVQIGPTLGYSYRSSESKVAITTTLLGENVRTSTLSYNNGFTYGYRIGLGYEFLISKKTLLGIRLDFANNQKAEINTLLGLKFGTQL